MQCMLKFIEKLFVSLSSFCIYLFMSIYIDFSKNFTFFKHRYIFILYFIMFVSEKYIYRKKDTDSIEHLKRSLIIWKYTFSKVNGWKMKYLLYIQFFSAFEEIWIRRLFDLINQMHTHTFKNISTKKYGISATICCSYVFSSVNQNFKMRFNGRFVMYQIYIFKQFKNYSLFLRVRTIFVHSSAVY